MLTKLNPDARAVKTSINLVPAGTLIFKPVNIPLEIVPIEITPVSEGVNVTVVPGTTVIVLFGAIDSYNFASIVIVLPTNDNAAVVEKNTSIEVMTPSLGIVKAKFVNVPDGLVKSIVLPMIDIPGAELPNPINAGVPTKPPAIVVKDTGKPDANGIIAEAPAAPVDPVGPVGPVAPSSPVAPVGPVGPVAPVAPVGPVGPVAPSSPVAPVGPVGPVAPVAPSSPVAPVGPVGPVAPSSPVAPVSPVGPVAPVTPVGPVGPVAPSSPVAPVDPVGPVAPVAPVGPITPVTPVGPVAPVTPVGPVAPVAPVGPVGHLIIIGGLHRQHGHHIQPL